VGLQLLYVPDDYKPLLQSRFPPPLSPALQAWDKVRARMPAMTNPIEFEVTQAMLDQRVEANK